MIQAKCIQKFRDNNNHIYGYRLIDINGQTQNVYADRLKMAIKQNLIHVVNLRLTSDYRLVDTTEKILPYEPLKTNEHNIIMDIESPKNHGIMEENKKKSIVSRKGKSSMRDYSNISDNELNKLCFVEADKKYITNTIKKSKQQVKEGKYKVIVSVTNVDEKKDFATL